MDNNKTIIAQIAAELNLPTKQIGAAVGLLQDGNTIPFIARYRKEVTQSLNEIQLRQIEDSLERINALAVRKLTVIKSIQEQGLMTAALQKAIDDCLDLQRLEVIYLPFKPKRRTRATIAREIRSEGEELAKKITAEADRVRAETIADAYSTSEQNRGVGDAESARVYAEAYSEDPEFYRLYRSLNAYREAFNGPGDVLLLQPDSDFFKYFNAPTIPGN